MRSHPDVTLAAPKMFWFFVGIGLVALWFLVAGDIPVQSPPSVAFLHPDLGIGGAERLVVDAGKCKYSLVH
jgi:hypothetical protein